MRAPSLRVKVTVAIVASLVLIGGAGAVVAEYNFREIATSHAREEARSRVASIAHVVDIRIHNLGQVASDESEKVDTSDPESRSRGLRRAGFTTFVVLDPNNNVMETGGDASANATLRAMMAGQVPPSNYPGRFIEFKAGWLIVAVRGISDYAVVGAIDRDTLTNSFLVDVLIEATDANAIVTRDGDFIATSLTFPYGAPAPTAGDSFAFEGTAYVREAAQLTRIQGQVAHLVPAATIEETVDALVARFVATSTIAIAIAGIVTVFIVSSSLRPLTRITDAAARLGRGEMDLQLEVRSRDEMGVLAAVLNSSALAIARANEAFQVAVGDLARSVGEAETVPEISRRLADAVLGVATARAVVVCSPHEVIALSTLDPADAAAARALSASDPDALRWWALGGIDEPLRMGILSPPERPFAEADLRKTEILVAQASLALHRARAMEKLDVQIQQKQMFVDILSHDLKNPIAVARGRIEMTTAKHPEVAPRLQPAEESLARATRIIEEAVLFSKLERMTNKERAEHDLAAMLGDVASALSPLALQRNITLEVSSPQNVPWLASPLLTRAVENLVSNAVKWSPADQTVHLRLEPDENACRIIVADHGPGIPPADRPRLFTRFERVDRVGVKGTGLGLAIAKRVVDLHEGSIAIEDTPGGGATFILTLPRPVAPVEPVQEETA